MSRHLTYFVGCLALYTALLMLSVQSAGEPQNSGDLSAIGASGESALGGPGAAPPPLPQSFQWRQETGKRPSRRHSFDTSELGREASLQAPIRRHSMLARLPPRTAEQEQQGLKKRRGRFQRVRGAVRRAFRRTKEKIRKAWEALKERARRAKASIRRGAARVYAKMSKVPWRRGRRTPEAQQPPAEEAGSPVAPPKPPRTFAYGGPRRRSVGALPFPPVEESEEGGMSEQALPGDGGPEAKGFVEPTPFGLKKGGPGEEEEGVLSEAPTEAPESAESSSEDEVFFTPPSSPTLRRRSKGLLEGPGAVPLPTIEEDAPPGALPGGEEEAPPGAVAGGEGEAPAGAAAGGEEEGFEEMAVPPPQAPEGEPLCGMWKEGPPSILKPVVEICPDLCALWTLFSRRGRLSQSTESVPALAAQLATTVVMARQLVKEGRAEPGTEKLMMAMRLAEAEDKVVTAADNTEQHCWYTSVSGVFSRANDQELRILQQAVGSLTLVFRNLEDLAQQTQRLMKLAIQSEPQCREAIQKELLARKELQRVMQEEEDKARSVSEEEAIEVRPWASQARKLASDLRLLRLRESCSMEVLHRIEIQSTNVTQVINEYMTRTRSWWRPQWFSQLSRLYFPPKGAPGVPLEIAQECRSFEEAEAPQSVADVHPFILWLFERLQQEPQHSTGVLPSMSLMESNDADRQAGCLEDSATQLPRQSRAASISSEHLTNDRMVARGAARDREKQTPWSSSSLRQRLKKSVAEAPPHQSEVLLFRCLSCVHAAGDALAADNREADDSAPTVQCSKDVCPLHFLLITFLSVERCETHPWDSRQRENYLDSIPLRDPRTPARLGLGSAARMNVGANIFGAHFGAYSFKNYLPVIAAVIVAAVVGEIAHNAKVKRQRRERNEHIAKLRQLVRKQKLKRDIALMDAEREEIAAMERMANAKRLLYRPEEIDRPVWQQRPRNWNPGVSVLEDLSFEDDYYPPPLRPHQLRYTRPPKEAALLHKSLSIANRRRRRTLSLRGQTGDTKLEEKDETSAGKRDAPAEAESPAEGEAPAE
ncbi:hypothetical protein Esti_002460 [Eimeria stiedai]